MWLAGYYLSPHPPVERPILTGWKLQRWESSSQQVGLHALFESSTVNYPSPSYPMRTSWRPVETRSIATTSTVSPPPKTLHVEDRPSDCRVIANIQFSGHGGEIAVCLTFGDVHVFSGPSLVPLDTFLVAAVHSPALPAFSPNGCCMAYAWHNRTTSSTVLKVVRVQPSMIPPGQALTSPAAWERHLADRSEFQPCSRYILV